ncbi:MAG: PH domain-containing protein [Phycisphaerales bacterium]|nr:PH domain-containing protein [Phycisphaerae bacterium]NNM27422.1 PH domain-containing protein [Phycisphaerales bacterium]
MRRDRTKSGVASPRQARIASSDAAGVEAEAASAGRGAALLPADLIRDDEIILLIIRPSVLYIPLSCITSLVFIAFLACLLAYLARWQDWIPWRDTQAFGLGVAAGFGRLGWQAIDWYSHVYVLTDQRVIRRMGVLRVAVFQTRLRQIQHTSVFRRVRERVFGLGTIGFATSGSDVFEAFWLMVRRPFAVHRTVVDAIERYGRGR